MKRGFFFVILILFASAISLFVSLAFPSFKFSFRQLFILNMFMYLMLLIVIPSILTIIKIIIIKLFWGRTRGYGSVILNFSFICCYPALIMFFLLNFLMFSFRLHSWYMLIFGRILAFIIIVLTTMLENFLMVKRLKRMNLEDSIYKNIVENKKFFFISLGGNLISYNLVMYLFHMYTGHFVWLSRIDWWYLLYQIIN